MMFSVIIPTFNRLNRVLRAIDSVLAQEFQDFEIIVVDDGSTDGTADEIRVRFPSVRVLQTENNGPAVARNIGARHARGAYLAFLDSDDCWFPWTLSSYCQAISRHNCGFLSGAAVDNPDSTGLDRGRLEIKVFRNYYEAGASGWWIGTCGCAIRRELFTSVGGFPETRLNAEDSGLWLRLGDVTPFVAIKSPPVFYYHRHLESQTACPELTARGALQLLQWANGNLLSKLALQDRRNASVILGAHLRPAAIAALGGGDCGLAVQLYGHSFILHIQQFRFKFLLGFPLLMAWKTVVVKANGRQQVGSRKA